MYVKLAAIKTSVVIVAVFLSESHFHFHSSCFKRHNTNINHKENFTLFCFFNHPRHTAVHFTVQHSNVIWCYYTA